MSDELVIRQVSATEEKRIVIGLITSDTFVNTLFEIISLDYFKSPHLKRIASWCLSYYEEFKTAPNKHIKDIYESRQPKLKEAESELIEKILSDLSNQFDLEQGSINHSFLINQARDYFRKRELEIHVNNISILTESGDLDAAEREIDRFNKVTIDIDESFYINPGDQAQRDLLYKKRDTQQSDFFMYPGDLGEFIGPLKPGDVVGITAPKKRGKCKSANTLVYLNDGTAKTIKEVVENKIEGVLSMNSSMHIVPGKAIAWEMVGIKEEYELVTKSGQRISAADTDPLFTPYGWKSLRELKTGDMVALSKCTNVQSSIQLGDAYTKLLAYLIADGHLMDKRIGFTKYSTAVMNDLISCLDFYGISYGYNKDRTAIRLHSSPINAILTDVGLMNCLSGDKFIPDSVLKSSNKCISVFLNTLFTCDGSIWKDRNTVHVEYSSKSKLLIQHVQMCLHRFGIIAKQLTKHVNGIPYYVLLLSSNPAVKRFLDCIGFSFHKNEKAQELYPMLIGTKDHLDVIPHKWVKEAGEELRAKGSGFNDETYRLAFNNGKHTSRNIFERVIGDHEILHTDLMWDYIVAIHKKNKKVPMYDLTVEGEHNFIANSFIVHNSFLLNDFFKHLILSKRTTVKWAIEMTDIEEMHRFDKLFYPTIDRKESGLYRYPVFDCMKNQTGDCGDRLSSVIIRDDPKTPYIDNPDHVICTKCRYDNPDLFEPTTYSELIHREVNNRFDIISNMEQYAAMLDKYSRIVTRPKYSLTYDLMMRDLDYMYKKWHFIPQALLLDYLDILDISSKFDDFRLEDERWKLTQRLASSTNCLVITPTQSNKEGEQSVTMKSTDQGGFYGKGRHVNLMLGINQVGFEKAQGLYRMTIMDARSSRSNENDYCIVLQDLKTGQMHLDSYWPNKNYNY